MDRQECFQCGTIMIAGDCATCAGAGKKEALVLVVSLFLIAVVLATYVYIKFL